MEAKPNDPAHIAARERVAKGIRLLVREGLIPNAGHISYRPSWRQVFLHMLTESPRWPANMGESLSNR